MLLPVSTRDPNEPLLSSDAIHLLQVTERTLRELTNRGALKCARTPGGVRIFRRGDVERLAVARSQERAAKARD
jgi:DNA-binding transcriptional MerR regulator